MAWLVLSIIICCFIGIDSVAMIAGHSRIGGPSSPLQKLCVTESCIAAAHNLFNVSFTFKDNFVLVVDKLQHYMFEIKYIIFKIIWDIPCPENISCHILWTDDALSLVCYAIVAFWMIDGMANLRTIKMCQMHNFS